MDFIYMCAYFIYICVHIFKICTHIYEICTYNFVIELTLKESCLKELCTKSGMLKITFYLRLCIHMSKQLAENVKYSINQLCCLHDAKQPV